RFLGLIQSQYWPPERLAAYREERLSKTLTAAAKIPFYAGRMDSDLRIEEFRRVPVLRRVEVESLYRSVYSLHRPAAHFARSLSSGTTGARAMFVFDRSHQRG